jgi:DNA-binding NtrC family response regulator
MSERIRILLVEDDEVDRMAFERFVAREGLPYDFSMVPNVATAAESLSHNQYDALITDHHLGDGTAFDVLDKAGSTPTVVVTGSTEQEAAARAMKMGARGYLIKDAERHYLKILPATVNNAIERNRVEKDRERLIAELQDAIAHIKTLHGLLPICAACKKIRDDDGYWHRLENYFRTHSEIQFTHGLCPECAEKMYKDWGLNPPEGKTNKHA